MYLPTIMKVHNEKIFSILWKYSKFVIPASLWFNWICHNQVYNFIYSEVIIPPKGVQKRDAEE